MKPLLLLTALLLGACASNHYDTNSAAYKQCNYEALAATPPSGNATQDGLRQTELLKRCMAAKGL